MEERKHIIELLNQSFLVSDATKDRLKKSLESFDEQTVHTLKTLLEEAEKKQYEFLQEAVKNNPNLVNELEEVYRKGIAESQKTTEMQARKKEEEFLHQLEQILQ